MTALLRTGNRGDALSAFRRAGELLAGGLGAAPGPALRAAARAVISSDRIMHGPPRGPDFFC